MTTLLINLFLFAPGQRVDVAQPSVLEATSSMQPLNDHADALLAAARRLDVAELGELIQSVAPAAAVGERGDSALHVAIRSGTNDAVDAGRRKAIVALLLASGLDRRAVNRDGETPLHLAALLGRAEVLDPLWVDDRDVDRADGRGRTPLHLAALGGHRAIIEWLLLHKANVGAVDALGETPLHLAARRLRADAARILLDHGANPAARNRAGQTALDLARGQGPDAPELRERIRLFESVLPAGSEGTAPPSDESTPRVPAYHTYPQIEAALLAAETNFPAICKRESIGQTLQGRTMWALRISDAVNMQEDEPEAAYLSTIHGDEVLGAEMCLNLVDYLTAQYGIDSRVTSLVNSVELWIIPCVNPDGLVAVTRGNANGKDLNRDFPDPYTSPANTTAGRQVETANIMNWQFGRSLSLAANFHTGTAVVNYPFDANATGQSVYTACPDDDLFIWASEQYSQWNLPMWNSASFYHGITNGADWYVVYGGMQDWAYDYNGCNEVTIELANGTPAASELPTYWANNRDAMLSYLETCLTGVRGVVASAATAGPVPASVSVTGRNHAIYCDPDVGDYHRMLRPGAYELRFTASGFDPLRVSGISVAAGAATRLDVTLWPGARVLSPNGGETLHAGRAAQVIWTGNPSAAFQVQSTANYGDVQTTNDGFESAALDPAYSVGGNLPWLTTTAVAHAGTRSARSGAITHNQTSSLNRNITGPANIAFWYRVDSESGYDFFNFYVDGVRLLHVSGAAAWTSFATPLAAGSHQIKWEYTKDVTVSTGADAAFIDDLAITADHVTWTDIVALTPVGATSATWTPASSSNAGKVRVRSVYPAGELGDWDESDAVFTIVSGPAPGDLNCDNQVSVDDVSAFVLALVDPDAYHATFPACDLLAADLNADTALDGRDVQPLVITITGGG